MRQHSAVYERSVRDENGAPPSPGWNRSGQLCQLAPGGSPYTAVLSRVFYHFAFLGISLALLGLGAAGFLPTYGATG